MRAVMGLLCLGLALPAGRTQEKVTSTEAHAEMFALPPAVVLTAQQQMALEALKKDYLPRLQEADRKIEKLLTTQRRQAWVKARDEALKAGKKGKEVNDAIEAALKLDDREKAIFRDYRGMIARLRAEITEKKLALLTEAQKKSLPK